MDFAKNQLINFAKEELIKQLQDKLNQGDAGIKELFVKLKAKLKNYTVLNQNVLQTILGAICIDPELAEKVKIELTTKISNINFSEELANMPQISEDIKLKIIALSETLKTELNNLFGELIDCPVATTGGFKQRDRKQKRRQKTKKRIHKRSRGRKQHSRK